MHPGPVVKPFPSIARLVGASFLGALLVGCGSEAAPDDGGDPDLAVAACAEQSVGPNGDGIEVLRCSRLFDAAPLVHLPDDRSDRFYGGFDFEGAFVTRDGVRHHLLASDGVTSVDCVLDVGGMPSAGCADAVWAPLHKLGHRRLYTLYRVTGALSKGGPDIVATEVRPLVTASPDAIADLYDRPFEGTGNLRLVPFPADAPIKFDTAKTARLRLEPVARDAPAPLPLGNEEGNLDQRTVAVEFVVANLKAGVASADGSCLPSLSSLGEANPFHTGTADRVGMTRFANMHAPGDDHLVMSVVDPTMKDTGIAVALGGSMDNDDGASHRVTANPHLWLDPGLSLDKNLAMSQILHGTPNGFTLEVAPAGAAAAKSCP